MVSSYFFRAPEIWSATTRHIRRTTWTELFYDLVFAAVISQIGSPLATDYSLNGIVRYVILLTLVFLAWLGYTTFSSQFASEDLLQRVLIVAQVFLIAVMAANANQPLSSQDASGFGAAYGAVRAVLALQYWRVMAIPETRGIVRRRMVGLILAAVVWAGSAFLSAPQRYVTWGIALLIDFATSWSSAKETIALPTGAIHFPERFGLLTIILLGEFVASVMRGIESQPVWSLPTASAAILSVALGFAFWSCYSDGAAGWEQRDLHSTRDVMRQRIWTALHLLLFLGIGLVGVGARVAIALPESGSFSPLQGWIICSSAAVIMLAVIGIAATSEHCTRRSRSWPWWIELLLAVAALLLGRFAAEIRATFVLLILFLLVAGQTVLLTLNRGMDAELEEI